MLDMAARKTNVDIIENRQLIPLITYGMFLKEQERRYKKECFQDR